MKMLKKWFAIGLILLAVIAFSGCSKTIKVSESSDNFKGMNYTQVIDVLEKSGFSDIETTEVSDLTSDSEMTDGEVETVSIDGVTDFNKNDKFPEGCAVTITYHSIPKISCPIGSGDLQGQEYTDIAALFTEAGCTNVFTDVVYDLDPDETDSEYVNEVQIGGVSEFAEEDEIPFDEEINVICHRPYEKYNVKVTINFISNLLFSKYDVEVFFDDESQGVLAHGEDKDYDFRVKEGTHTFRFENAKDSSVHGETSLDVDCDIEAAYTISCDSDEISVAADYIDYQRQLGENETKVSGKASDYIGNNYKDVVQVFTGLGFTNIKAEPLYDIIWGITSEESVDSVMVAGTNDFNRGDVFQKDAEVVITYHMAYDKDPNYVSDSDYEKTEETTENTKSTAGNESAEEEHLTVDNCQELKDLLAVKDPLDPSVSSFASKYNGRIIEFDGRIDYCAKRENKNTRFDYLVSAGDYNPEHQIGPTFKFEDVNYSDLHTNLDTVRVGLNVHIVAEVVSYQSSSGLFFLEPVSVTGR